MPPSSSRRIRQVSFKNEAVLDVNIESLDSLYDEQGNLDAKFKFTVKDGYEEKFCGSLIVIHQNNHRRRTRGCSRCTCTPTITQSPKIYSIG